MTTTNESSQSSSSTRSSQPYTQMQENKASSYLQQLMQGLGAGRQAIAADKQTLDETTAENQLIRDAMLEAQTQMGALQQQQAAIDMGQALELQKRNKAVADVFGVDILDPNNRIAMLVHERDAAVDETLAQGNRAAQLASTNLWESPFEYMIQRPFLQENLTAASRAQKKTEFIDSEIQKLQQEVKSTLETQAAINTSFTEEEAKIQAQVTALTAADAVRKLNLTQNKELLGELKASREMREEDIRLLDIGYKAKRHEDEFLMRREQFKQDQAARNASKKIDQLSQAAYNASAKALRKPQIENLEEFQAQWNAFKGTEVGKVMADMILHGQTILGASTQPGGVSFENYIGRDPGETVTRLVFAQGTLPPEAQVTAEYLFREADLAEQKATADKPGLKLSEENIRQLTNKSVMGEVVVDKSGKAKKVTGSLYQMQSNVEQPLHGGRVQNIYKAPDINTVGQAYPALTQTRGWKEVIEPVAILDGGAPTANAVMKEALLRVKEGKLSAEEAADTVTSFYKAASDLNNKTRMYLQTGLQNQKGYPVLLDAPKKGILSYPYPSVGERIKYSEEFSSVPVDMANDRSKVLHYIISATIPEFGALRGAK